MSTREHCYPEMLKACQRMLLAYDALIEDPECHRDAWVRGYGCACLLCAAVGDRAGKQQYCEYVARVPDPRTCVTYCPLGFGFKLYSSCVPPCVYGGGAAQTYLVLRNDLKDQVSSPTLIRAAKARRRFLVKKLRAAGIIVGRGRVCREQGKTP